MAEALTKTEAQLRQSQKMEVVGQLTGGVAHDFNNLLTVVIGSLDVARRRLESTNAEARVLRNIGNAIDGAQRAATLTHRLLAFSASPVAARGARPQSIHRRHVRADPPDHR